MQPIIRCAVVLPAAADCCWQKPSYLYNYFELGLDLGFCAETHTVNKVPTLALEVAEVCVASSLCTPTSLVTATSTRTTSACSRWPSQEVVLVRTAVA